MEKEIINDDLIMTASVSNTYSQFRKHSLFLDLWCP